MPAAIDTRPAIRNGLQALNYKSDLIRGSTMAKKSITLAKTISSFTLITPLLALSGCAVPTNVQQIDKLESVGESPTIALMPPDIRYYLVTAGGVPEPNAEWTESAQANFMTATLDYAEEIGANIKAIDKNDLGDEEVRYDTLHSAVGRTIMENHFGIFKLPSKADNFDWSLGPGVSTIADRYGADYALFVHYRDYQASGGRVAMGIFTALVTGVAAPMGAEQGFASLVDLKTGDIVWFNVVAVGSGELRKEDGAATAVRGLFKDIPTREGTSESQ